MLLSMLIFMRNFTSRLCCACMLDWWTICYELFSWCLEWSNYGWNSMSYMISMCLKWMNVSWNRLEAFGIEVRIQNSKNMYQRFHYDRNVPLRAAVLASDLCPILLSSDTVVLACCGWLCQVFYFVFSLHSKVVLNLIQPYDCVYV